MKYQLLESMMYFASHAALCFWMLAGTCALAEGPLAWRRHVIDDSSRGADGVRLADFNGDGRLDVVTGWEEGGVVRVYLHPPTEQVADRWPAVTAGLAPSVEDAVAADLDQDGRLDVISCCEGKTRTIFVHWAPAQGESLLDAENWQTEPIPASVGAQMWMFCLPMQVDGKRGIDLVVGSKGSQGAVGWWESPADPRDLTAWRYHELARAGWIMSLFARDVDQDGDQDIIYSDRKGPTRGVRWLEHPGPESYRQASISNPPWQQHVLGATDKEVMFLGLGDLDQDGAEDIVAMTWNGHMELFRRRPGSMRWRRSQVANAFGLRCGKSVAIADFDRDGRPDLVTTNRSEPLRGPAIALMRYRQSPAEREWLQTDIGGGEGSKFDLIEPLDVDADGDLDVITCEEVANLGVVWYENPLRAPP